VVLRGELAARIDGLRLGLGSTEVDRIPPHITLVPPFNARAGDLPRTLATLRAGAASMARFRCALGPVVTFDRPRPVLYLAVGDQAGSLAALAQASRAGPLAPTPREDRHVFVPHVTVANRSSVAVADAARRALGAFATDLEVTDFSLLRLEESGEPDGRRRWVEIADFPLGRPTVRGRGGVEIELTLSRMVDPESLERLDELDQVARSRGEPWAVTARTDGSTVAVARGTVAGETARIDAFVVATTARGIGVGTRTLEHVEAMALDRGLREVVVSVSSANKARYFTGRGYVPVESTAADRDLLRKVVDRTI
jgi:2'-5' RNA ligase/GNAT superfamily N-acetyltransferase